MEARSSKLWHPGEDLAILRTGVASTEDCMGMDTYWKSNPAIMNIACPFVQFSSYLPTPLAVF
jgi:hypothetical protein